MMRLDCWTDGSTIKKGRKGNGPSAIGIVVADADTEQIIFAVGEYIGHATNNYAEFYAVERCLELIMDRFEEIAFDIHVISDSKLVVETMKENWELKQDRLIKVQRRIERLEVKLGSKPTYVWVRGHSDYELNEIADLLAYTVAKG